MDSFNVTIGQDRKQVFINVYYNNRRYRFWNGKAIEIKLRCADNPQLLKAAFQLKLREGWRPQTNKKEVKETPITVIKALNLGVETKMSQGCSERFIKDAKRIVTLWKRFEIEQRIKNFNLDNLQSSHIRKFLVRPNWSAKT